jgi:hypothetical protein
MKSVILLLIGLVAGLGVAWIISETHKSSSVVALTSNFKPNSPFVSPSPGNIPHPVNTGLLVAQQWQELRNDRETALRNNPDLATEYRTLVAEMDAQQKKLDAAMISADPKVAPVVAKLDIIRQRNSIPH